MSALRKLEEEKEMDREINRRVNEMFKRVYSIKRIRRRKRIKKWLGRHVN